MALRKRLYFINNEPPLKHPVYDHYEKLVGLLGCFVHDSRNNRYALSCRHLIDHNTAITNSEKAHVFTQWDTDDESSPFVHLSSRFYGIPRNVSHNPYYLDIGLYGPILCPMSRNTNKQRINVVDVSGVKIGQKCYIKYAKGQASGEVIETDLSCRVQGSLKDAMFLVRGIDDGDFAYIGEAGAIVYLQPDDSQSEYLNAIGLVSMRNWVNGSVTLYCVYLRPGIDFLEEKFGKLHLFDYPLLPPEDDANLDYNKEEKENLAKTCSTKVLFAGKTGAGKSSLVKTLKEDDKKMVRPDQRTRVMNFHNWAPKELEIDGNQMSAIFTDLGGHSSYETTVKFFSGNDSNNVNVIAHKIDDEDYESSYQWLKNLVYRSHRCKYLFVLTQLDSIDITTQLKSERIKLLCKKFKTRMCDFLELDIQKLTTMAEEPPNPDKFKNVLATFKALKRSISKEDSNLKSVFCITCNNECQNPEILAYDESMAFKQKLVEFCRAGFTLIPEVYQKMFLQIGRVGLKSVADMKEESTIASNVVMSSEKAEEEAEKETTNESTTLTEPITSDQTESNKMAEVGDSDESGDESNEVELQYITWEEAEKMFNEVKQECHSTDDETLENCLTMLNAKGMLWWFDFTRQSRKIIFNDFPSFIAMVRSLFDHSLEEDGSLKWDSLKPRQKGIFKRKERREDVYTKHHYNKIFEEGIMTKELLKVLLMRYTFEAHVETVIDLLCNLDICFRVDKGRMFFPWYLKSTGEKAGIAEFLKWIIPSSNVALSRVLQFSGYITRPLFHMFVVALHKRIQLNLNIIDKKHIWDNGMCVHLGNIAVALVHEANRKIYAIVKANGTQYQALEDLYNFLMILNDTLQEITEKECSDAIEAIGLLCPVCTSRNKAFCHHIISVANIAKSVDFTMPPTCGVFEDQIDSSCLHSPSITMECGHGTPKQGRQGVSKLFLPPFKRGQYNLPEKEKDDFVKELGHLMDISFETEEHCKYMLGSASLVTPTFDGSENLKSDSTKHSDKNDISTPCDSPPSIRCATGFDGEDQPRRPTYSMVRGMNTEDIRKIEKMQKYVCKIEYPCLDQNSIRKAFCATGFVFGFYPIDGNVNQPRCLVMTNMHIHDQLSHSLTHNKHECQVVFNNHDSGSNVIPATVKITGICRKAGTQIVVGDSKLDYLLIQLDWNKKLHDALKDSTENGGLALLIEDSKDTKRMVLLGHPAGDTLRYDNLMVQEKGHMNELILAKQNTAFRQNRSVVNPETGHNLKLLNAFEQTDHLLFYTTLSYQGSSGSPCFEFMDNSDEIHLVGLHCNGIYATNSNPQDGDPCEYGIGVRLSKIKEHMKDNIPGFNG